MAPTLGIKDYIIRYEFQNRYVANLGFVLLKKFNTYQFLGEPSTHIYF